MMSVIRPRLTAGFGERRYPRALIVAVALSLVSITVRAQESPDESPPVTVKVEVVPGSFTVGDAVHITLTFTYSEGTEVGVPMPGEEWGGLQMSSVEIGDPRPADAGGWVRQDHLTGAAFAPGPVEIPPLTIPYYSAKGVAGEVLTPPIDLVIQSILATPEAAEISDLKNPHSLPRVLWPWIVAAGAVLVTAGGLAYYLRWRRRRQLQSLIESSAEPPLLPYDWALRELDRLARSDLLAEGRWLDYHVLLAEVLKGYLSRRYGVQALELTTSELIFSMRVSKLGSGLVSDVRGVLEACDIVKFARHESARTEAEGVLERTRAFVESTRPPEPAEAVG